MQNRELSPASQEMQLASQAEQYLNDRLAVLDIKQLQRLPESITTSVVIPIYGEPISDVIDILYQLSKQQDIDLQTVQVVCVINSPNNPHTLADFKGNQVDYDNHLSTFEAARQLNQQLSEVLLQLTSSHDVTASLEPEDIDKLHHLKNSQLRIAIYNVDQHRLPDNMSSLGGARDVGIAGIAYRIAGSTISFNQQTRQRLADHIIVQTDVDGIVPPNFVALHTSHYRGEQAHKTHAVLGEVNIQSTDPNIRILALQARLRNRVRLGGFHGFAHNTNLSAQNAATGCNLSYRLLSAMAVGGVPHDKSLDDWRFVGTLDQLRGTYLDSAICVSTSPRYSARAVGGFGSNQYEYLRRARFDTKNHEYQDIAHAIYAGFILDQVAEWYKQPSAASPDQLLEKLTLTDFDCCCNDLFVRNVGIQNVLEELTQAVSNSQTLTDFMKSSIAVALKKALFTRSINPVNWQISWNNIIASLAIINPEYSQKAKGIITYAQKGQDCITDEVLNDWLNSVEKFI